MYGIIFFSYLAVNALWWYLDGKKSLLNLKEAKTRVFIGQAGSVAIFFVHGITLARRFIFFYCRISKQVQLTFCIGYDLFMYSFRNLNFKTS